MRAVVFVLAVALVAASAAPLSNLSCLADLYTTGTDLEAAAASIEQAVAQCKGNGTGCVMLISEAVSDLAGASGNLAKAMKDCGGKNNTECTTNISFLVSDVAAISAVVTRAVVQCNPFSIACVKDIVVAGADVGKTLLALRATIKTCESSSNQ